MIKKLVYKLALRKRFFIKIYMKFFNMNASEYAEYLKKINYCYSIGENCHINKFTAFTDPKYVSIGNNTHLSACHLIGHDGAIAVYAQSTGKILDKVGKIVIGDNCFIGYRATILPNVIIGNNSIIAAGAVVTSNVPEGSIFGGIPAKKIGETVEYILKIEQETKEYPWYDLIKNRTEVYDDELEKKLLVKRMEYFFGNGKR